MPNFLGNPESMTKNLSFETYLMVLVQFDEKWHIIKDSYFTAQSGVKKWKLMRLEITCVLQNYVASR